MYSTISEAMSIYRAISPSNRYTILEEVGGASITGTAAELYRAIIEAGSAAGANVSHVPATPGDVEAWAIIEAAYNS